MASTTITHTSGVCGGRACIAGTRVPVWIIVLARRTGASYDTILAELPSLRPWQLDMALIYYVMHQDEIDRDVAEQEEETHTWQH